ncbi:MAG: nuclear transport factor 2 family protein [Hydrogenophilaceae bacterium]|nr:nuclear transport factor 2 family protein [Hydrogenophilaceae bacterium]
MRRGLLFGLTAALLLAACATTSAPNQRPTEASLRAADAEQMRIIVEEDAAAQQDFMHPNYLLNGPANVVKHKAEVVAMLARGYIASDSFTRNVEGVAITGDVGIVMGSEIVTPAPDSELGRLHPGRTLHRRYTNVFLWENGQWRFLARQATVVPSPH